MRRYLLPLLIACGPALAACASSGTPPGDAAAVSSSALAQDLAMTRPLGLGPGFRPDPLGNRLTATGAPVGRWRCTQPGGGEYGAHIELFAHDHEVQVPAGIGIAAPQRRRGAFVLGGRCVYQLRTVDPTGVVRVRQTAVGGPTATVGELFGLWGQALSRTRLGGFHGSVEAFVAGKRWTGDPRAIPLTRHTQIVLELRSTVRPHPFYLFPAGL